MGLWHAAVSHRGVLPEVEALPGEEEVGDVAELVQLRYPRLISIRVSMTTWARIKVCLHKNDEKCTGNHHKYARSCIFCNFLCSCLCGRRRIFADGWGRQK
mmetsp:Transcript_16285/g.13380  ORF Transcript_16285/g.13380 Transcript_16285/m.13380 type:complete len:101 (+) Transcript_16285:888-1190(+)